MFVKWKGCSSAFNSWIPLADVEQLWTSTSSIHGNPATAAAVVKTVLSFLEMCEGLLLERVDVGRQRSSSTSCYNPTGWITVTCTFCTMLRKGFEASLSKQQISNVFANQEALHAANVSPLSAINTFSGARSGNIRIDWD